MASNAKKYILTAVTLGLIAASGALLIAGANMITRDRIAENEQKSITNGIATIFGDGVSKEECELPTLPDGKEYTYITTCYEVKDADDFIAGYAFRTDGSNNYGKISLIIGFNTGVAYKGLSVIANEQSFASTLKKGYLDKIKDGSKTIHDPEVSVSCGATYGAQLVRAMVQEAEDTAEILVGVKNG